MKKNGKNGHKKLGRTRPTAAQQRARVAYLKLTAPARPLSATAKRKLDKRMKKMREQWVEG